MTERQSHPHVDDGGTLDWYTDLDDALAAASAASASSSSVYQSRVPPSSKCGCDWRLVMAPSWARPVDGPMAEGGESVPPPGQDCFRLR